jgi:PAS domain S-box-containing protein
MNDWDRVRPELIQLRQRAEAVTKRKQGDHRDLSGLTAEEISRLVHELEVQQTELEMQNDELRLAQVALELARDRYTELFDLAPVSYFILDAKGRIQQANHSAAQLLGMDRRKLIHHLLQEFIASQDQDSFFRHLRQGFIHPDRERLELEMHREDGTRFHAQIVSVAEQNAAGSIEQCLTVILDITERKKSERLLREADRRKDEFLATLSHELRNPLTPIINALHILNLQDMPEVTHQAAREMIDRQLQHMVRLIDDLLDVSRITGGKFQLRKERIELSSVLEQAIEASRPNLDSAAHRLKVEPAQWPIYLDADPVRLTQAFVNLLNNACTYTDDGGEICLHAGLEGTQAVIRVSDNGIGIDAQHLPHVFDKFFQLDETQGRPKSGLGIGLWLTRELVESHQGSIEVTSDGPGKGSQFIVRLTAEAASQVGQTAESDHDTQYGSTNRRILVVDDNQDVVASLALLLQLSGNEVERAHDGLEAVAAAERFRPDVVLLDIGMPNLDGYGACGRIRRLPGGEEMVIIALTGWGKEDDRRKTTDAGFDAHLVKPINPDTLQRLLEEELAGKS